MGSVEIYAKMVEIRKFKIKQKLQSYQYKINH